MKIAIWLFVVSLIAAFLIGGGAGYMLPDMKNKEEDATE